MRVALLSDIHGNAAALRAVCADLATQAVDEHWVLGDVFGYGPSPIPCFHLLDGLDPRLWLLGNHDLAALVIAAEGSWEGKAVRDLVPGLEERLILQWHTAMARVGLEPGRLERLRHAPTWQRMAPGVFAAHGAMLVNDPAAARNVSGRNSYCKAHSEACNLTLDRAAKLEGGPVRLVAVGHTHIPAVGWARVAEPPQPRDWSWRSGEDLSFDGAPVALGDAGDSPVLLCPGSIGQPRESGGAGAAVYAIVDLAAWTAAFRRVRFDAGETAAAMEPMPRGLAELLELRKAR